MLHLKIVFGQSCIIKQLYNENITFGFEQQYADYMPLKYLIKIVHHVISDVAQVLVFY